MAFKVIVSIYIHFKIPVHIFVFIQVTNKWISQPIYIIICCLSALWLSITLLKGQKGTFSLSPHGQEAHQENFK